MAGMPLGKRPNFSTCRFCYMDVTFEPTSAQTKGAVQATLRNPHTGMKDYVHEAEVTDLLGLYSDENRHVYYCRHFRERPRGEAKRSTCEAPPLSRLMKSLRATVAGQPGSKWTSSSTPPICSAVNLCARQIPRR